MARTVLLLLAGTIAGGAAVYFVAGGDFAGGEAGPAVVSAAANNGVRADAPGAVASDAGASNTGVSDTGGLVAVRVAAYERALGATGVIDLESTIELALASPRSRARDLDITALLARLAELDPRRAVDFSQTAFLDAPFQIQVFAALARVDADAAVTALARVTPAAKQRRVALALLDVLGFERGVALVGTALPDEARASFELDALIARAETDPGGSMAEALTLNTAVLPFLLPRLAEAAARSDPEAALALADSIDNFNLRFAYRLAVLNAWAELDPEGAFAFLETADPALQSVSAGAFATLAGHDPDRLLAMIGELPPGVRISARRAVIQSLAERDPEAALAMLDTMPAGQDREQMLSTIAQAYGRRDPEVALAWVKSLSPPWPRALQGVLQGIAAVDANRAIDLLIEDLDAQSLMQPSVARSLAGAMPVMRVLWSSQDADVGRLANALLERNDPQLGSLVTLAVSIWASQDRDAALTWTLANGDRLDPGVFRSTAQRMALESFDVALSMLDQVAPAHRPYWIEGMTSHLAQTDIARAQTFLSQLRGQPGYDEAYGVVLQTMARTDPEGAARMLSDAPASANVLQSAPFMIASRWASRDPAAAARWAVTIEDPQMQRSAVTTVASTWAQSDAAGAERWLFGLANGPDRDAAADGYIASAAQTGRFEPRWLDAYSSEQARQEGASRAIVAIGRADPARAEALLDRYVQDPAMRARAEEQLARSLGASGPALISDVVNIISAQ